MPDPIDLDARLAAAQADAANAVAALDRETVRASEERLAQLKRSSVDRRFKALEDADLALIPSHRRELIASLRGSTAAMPRLGAPTATWWEIARSRLRYHVFAVGVGVIAVVTGIVLTGLAVALTPKQWVEIAAPQTVLAPEVMPDGSSGIARVAPGERFALITIVGDQGVLRAWVAGTGYATITVPVGTLKAAN